jgi:hypothetical protein
MNDQIWRPIKEAPRDGRILILLVDNSDSNFPDGGDPTLIANPLEDARFTRTVGHNSYEHSGLDEWHFAGWDWDYDTYTTGKAEPILFALLPEIPDEYRDPVVRGRDEGRDEI